MVEPPDGWQLYYQEGSKITKVKGILTHRLLIDSFHEAVIEIWNYAKQQVGGTASDDQIRAWLHDLRLDQENGGFEFGPITGGRLLSLHSYGIAIDWDAEHNPRKNH